MRWGFALGFCGALACNSFDERAEDGPLLIVPTDERPAVRAEDTPVPIAGGTLHATSDGSFAIVADEDRDLVSVVDLSTHTVARTWSLEAGDRPGRIVDGADGVVYIALRGSGAVLTLDPATGQILSRVSVCRAPRGLAFDAELSELHVACAEGRVVTIDPASGAVARTVELDPDLRDVMIRGSELWLTRFKSAEVIRLDASGQIAARSSLPSAIVEFPEPQEDGLNTGLPERIRTVAMSSTVAWRSVPAADGGAVIVHQESAKDEVTLSEPSVSGSAYGGASSISSIASCGGIVRTAVSVVRPDGTVAKRDIVASPPLPVDVAQSPDGQWIAIAHAGIADPEAPRPFLVFPEEHGGISSAGREVGFGGSVSLLRTESLAAADTDNPCTFTSEGAFIPDPVVAVAYAPDGRLLAQSREPPRLWVQSAPLTPPSPIALPGEDRLDTGHELFHRDSGGGIACASCHPEGAEDGHVWRFSGVGERRTQALHVGLGDTAPFHWDGALRDVGTLMSEVFVGRMGGVKQNADRLTVLEDWLFSIERPPPIRAAADEAAQRGEALFFSSEAACATCHSGSSLTNNESRAVGTLPDGARLQVPSLVAIGYRAPFMHDGCAATLFDRFDPACGGSSHGRTSHLSEAQIADLVAFLETL